MSTGNQPSPINRLIKVPVLVKDQILAYPLSLDDKLFIAHSRVMATSHKSASVVDFPDISLRPDHGQGMAPPSNQVHLPLYLRVPLANGIHKALEKREVRSWIAA